MKKLTINEQLFLIAIWHLKDNAYGITIRKKVIEISGQSFLFGTVYNTLEYLVKKGYIKPHKKNHETDGQNKKRVFYGITPHGIEALQQARDLQKSMWNSMPEVILQKEN